MLVGARGREGAGHADEDGRPVAQRLCTGGSALCIAPCIVPPRCRTRCRARAPLPMPVVAGPRGRSVCAMGVHAARLGERQHGRLDVRHWRRARLRVSWQLEEQRLNLLPRVRVRVRGRARAAQDRPKWHGCGGGVLHAGWQEAEAVVHRRRRGCTTSGSAAPTAICSGASTARLARPRPKSCIATGGERISAGRTTLPPCSASVAQRANSAITRGNPQRN